MLKARIREREIILPKSFGKAEGNALIIDDLIIVHKERAELKPIRGLTKGLIGNSVKAVRAVREEWM